MFECWMKDWTDQGNVIELHLQHEKSPMSFRLGIEKRKKEKLDFFA